MVSINQELNASGLGQPAVRALRKLFIALMNNSNASTADLVIMAGKLDVDAGVTSTDYNASLLSPTTGEIKK